MNYFLVGLTIMAFGLAVGAYSKVTELEKRLKNAGLLKEND